MEDNSVRLICNDDLLSVIFVEPSSVINIEPHNNGSKIYYSEGIRTIVKILKSNPETVKNNLAFGIHEN